jgi:hypothetical protein
MRRIAPRLNRSRTDGTGVGSPSSSTRSASTRQIGVTPLRHSAAAASLMPSAPAKAKLDTSYARVAGIAGGGKQPKVPGPEALLLLIERLNGLCL